MNPLIDLAKIVHRVAEAGSPEKQVNVIVESICQSLAVGACCLYLINPDGSLRRVASRGLTAKSGERIIMPAGKGLIGAVASQQRVLNIPNVMEHPSYWPMPRSSGDPLQSFCGVPLIKAGQVIGVLVVRDHEARSLTPDEEAFLVTLGAQLVLLLAEPALFEPYTSAARRIKGVKGAPGLAIGKVRLCSTRDLFAVDDAPCVDIPQALQQWRALLAEVRDEVQIEQNALGDELGENVSGIFTAYQMLLSDPLLTEEVEAGIRSGNWLPGALRQATEQFAKVFMAMEDPYLQARHEDIRALGNKLYAHWHGVERTLQSPEQPVVLMGTQVSLSEMASIAPDKLKGVVCFSGSGLSHTAVLANALGIPAVMGVGNLLRVKQGQTIIVDGDNGQIILNPGRPVKREYVRLIGANRKLEKSLVELRDLPAVTVDGETVRLLTNTGLVADISPGLARGAEGIGLYRTEIPFMVRDSFPTEEEQVSVYRKVLKAYEGKPVYMRILDVGGDKPLPYFPVQEDNPALGWRGIRFCLDNSHLLLTQIRAMLRSAEGLNNLHVLLPLVSSVDEIKAFRVQLHEAYRQLLDEGITVQLPQVGVMLEVPAAISQLRFWRPLIDFISIGSNDLSQYLLALDRNNSRVSTRFDPLHPAVLHELERIITLAKELELPVSLCGEMASDPEVALLLVGLGFTTLSMSSARLPRIKWLIRHLSREHAEKVARHALTLDHAQAIREAVQQEFLRLGLDVLCHP